MDQNSNIHNGNTQQQQQINCETSDYAESSLMDEVHEVQEDRARSFLQDFLKSSQKEITNQQFCEKGLDDKKCIIVETDKLHPTSQISSHFEELRTRQREEQRKFHQKLMHELTTSKEQSRTKTTSSFSGSSGKCYHISP